jgi:hypothetical protein
MRSLPTQLKNSPFIFDNGLTLSRRGEALATSVSPGMAAQTS